MLRSPYYQMRSLIHREGGCFLAHRRLPTMRQIEMRGYGWRAQGLELALCWPLRGHDGARADPSPTNRSECLERRALVDGPWLTMGDQSGSGMGDHGQASLNFFESKKNQRCFSLIFLWFKEKSKKLVFLIVLKLNGISLIFLWFKEKSKNFFDFISLICIM